MPALHVLQSVVSGVAVHLLKSADTVIEGHVLLNAGFFFFGCISRDQTEKM